MKTSIRTLLLLLISVTAVNTTQETPTTPNQSALNSQAELPPGPTSVRLLYLPERLREREIRALDNSSFRLSDFKGKVIVINLWASWCGPCKREIPEYERVRKAYFGRDVEFVGLTTEDQQNSPQVNKFLQEIKFGFRLGWSNDELTQALMNGKTTIPQTIVLGRSGRILNHWVGYSSGMNGRRLKQTIDDALANSR